MIVAHGYAYIKDGVTIFCGSEAVPCPVCGGRLTVHGTCRRKLRSKEGTREYRLRVMECSECGRTHRELPECMIPYKRMEASSVAEIAEADAQKHLEVAETSTWRRICAWVRWFLWYAWRVLESLRACHPAFATNSPVGSAAELLVYFVRLVVNSGNWIQHRSVQTTS